MRVFTRVAVVLLLLAVVGGIGFGIWDAGYDQGIIDGADATTEIVVTERGRGFSPFGIFFGIFLLLFLFKFAFGWRRWGGHHKGYGPGGYRGPMEDRMSRWHDDAHGRQPRADAASEPPSPVS